MCCTILVLPVHMRDVRYDADLATVYKNGAAEVRFVNGGAYMKISTHQVSSHLALCINGHRAPLTPAHIHALALAEESKERNDAEGVSVLLLERWCHQQKVTETDSKLPCL